MGQRFSREVFNAFAASPQWEHGLFVLTYHEWGGFFDHVKPPILADARATPDLDAGFGLAFLGAPPEGPGGSAAWNLTRRDRNANNIGASLAVTHPDPDLGDTPDIEIGPYRAECPPGVTTDTPPLPEGEHPDPFVVHEELEEQPARDSPVATHTPWLDVNP